MATATHLDHVSMILLLLLLVMLLLRDWVNVVGGVLTISLLVGRHALLVVVHKLSIELWAW